MACRELPCGTPSAQVYDLDREGRGVARVGGKTVFVSGALPGEEVRVRYQRAHARFDEGVVDEVLRPSPERVTPRCPHFGTCGGCKLQHLVHDAQVRAKQAQLAGVLRAHAGLEPERWLDPLSAHPWGYRRSARLGVRYVPQKGGALVGFREIRSSRVAVLEGCDVLHPSAGARVQALRALVNELKARRRIPQIAVAVGDAETALVFRHLVPLGPEDRATLIAFARQHELRVYLQPAGPQSITALWPENPGPLRYGLPEFELEFLFEPADFIQVNAEVNRLLVSRAVALLAPEPSERVLDLFCGLGNFTLAIARRAGEVLGLEGEVALVERARTNARHNAIGNAAFASADLATGTDFERQWAGRWHKLILDPPRTGAARIVDNLRTPYPERIVYVSCNPATLARDAAVLVKRHGFYLAAAGAVDMFPHTAHTEAITVFQRAS
ncbi:MAG: 23S rRNA (uracil(1939)-C(5))-methyltransferase RlmD [Gammaproteobacteria bacterium]|nr:23S rRNA (uracil(1939)-C(5))-methyltransferase RlmD [Gammaproteobacteria bacterium]NIR84283.1 23S rRNA (uracil(1939)-C(5))-methyltransferase RlmD [Gammaproteobacteria bacterium]NIR89753.1 23S rRNA (uracil(1939)-C(5))-methyltransferase RlmD [Gammaproteobacteria bacterium]NIU05441.1 23S rRNA (uracil(1939)-C(5))-methyltransferase RlmD [Gammaproteobacteria bacterium]NIV52387.1 23S rRNA (uracil(1939)-C(5))-methyltransferase RlmD [Gammaproteobacteria bacterium]